MHACKYVIIIQKKYRQQEEGEGEPQKVCSDTIQIPLEILKTNIINPITEYCGNLHAIKEHTLNRLRYEKIIIIRPSHGSRTVVVDRPAIP